MTWTLRNTLKNIVLVSVMLTSFVLVGILWNQQSEWFSPSFRLFAGTSDPLSMQLDKHALGESYLSPSRMVVSGVVTEGVEMIRYELLPSDGTYQSIWRDVARNYLDLICQNKPTAELAADSWNKLLSLQSIFIDFRTPLKRDLLIWLANASNYVLPDFEQVESIIILPQEDINENKMTFYLKTEDHVYRYLVTISNGNDAKAKAWYNQLPVTLQEQKLPQRKMIADLPPIAAKKDLVIDLSGPDTTQSFPLLRLRVPESLDMQEENRDGIQEQILLNLKDSMSAMQEPATGDIVFSDTANVYRLTSKGLLKYDYLPGQSNQDKGKMADALQNAMVFLQERKGLMAGMSLQLAQVESFTGAYQFQFVYLAQGMPVMQTKRDNPGTMINPITVTANGKRIISCSWLVREAIRTQNKAYDVFFPTLLEIHLLKLQPNPVGGGRTMTGLCVGYSLSEEIPVLDAEPQWLVHSGDLVQTVPMDQGGTP